MRKTHPAPRPFTLTLIAAAIVGACGGGGGGSSDTGLPPLPPAPQPAPVTQGPTIMSCVDGPGYQCSGNLIYRTDNGVSITSSGVQAYATSTSDLLATNPDPTDARGFRPSIGGTAEMRLKRDSSGAVTQAAMILDSLGIFWKEQQQRPPIVEAFNKDPGISGLAPNGSLTNNPVLPLPSDTAYYDFATLGTAGTQANYANNRYFPRNEPSRCPPTVNPCPTTETDGAIYIQGNFRVAGGSDPDRTNAHRLHSDGDIHGGNAADGQPFLGSSGVGIPFPGNKGYRDLISFSFNYSSIAAWVSQDTALVDEWAQAGKEHTLNRRGIVAFGETTDPTAVPQQGTVIYRGIAFGSYTTNGENGLQSDLISFRATAVLEANFATRQVAIRVTEAKVDGTTTAVPVSIAANAGFGAAGTNVTNYMTGPVNGGTEGLSGGAGGRFFGPAAEEIAGTFTLKNGNAATVGGFIARKQ